MLIGFIELTMITVAFWLIATQFVIPYLYGRPFLPILDKLQRRTVDEIREASEEIDIVKDEIYAARLRQQAAKLREYGERKNAAK